MSWTDLMLVKSWWWEGQLLPEFLMNTFFSSEEEMDTTPAPATKAKKAGMVKAKEESEEEEDDEEEDEEEEDDEEEDDEDEGGCWWLNILVSACLAQYTILWIVILVFLKFGFFLFPETPKPAKRKAEAKKETPPAKKAKADGEGGNCAELLWLSGFGFKWLKCINTLLLLSQDFHCLSETWTPTRTLTK